jgi:hypothetical protein
VILITCSSHYCFQRSDNKTKYSMYLVLGLALWTTCKLQVRRTDVIGKCKQQFALRSQRCANLLDRALSWFSMVVMLSRSHSVVVRVSLCTSFRVLVHVAARSQIILHPSQANRRCITFRGSKGDVRVSFDRSIFFYFVRQFISCITL